MKRDPEISGENMEHFDPTRYLDASGGTVPRVTDGHLSYSFWPQNLPRSSQGQQLAFHRHGGVALGDRIWGKYASGRFHPLDIDGCVDLGLVVLADFITYRYVDANEGVSEKVRSCSNSISLHNSWRQLPCEHRNESSGGYRDEVTQGCIHARDVYKVILESDNRLYRTAY